MITVEDILKLARIASDADFLARGLVDEKLAHIMATVGHGGDVAKVVISEFADPAHDGCIITCMSPEVYEQWCQWVPDQEEDNA